MQTRGIKGTTCCGWGNLAPPDVAFTLYNGGLETLCKFSTIYRRVYLGFQAALVSGVQEMFIEFSGFCFCRFQVKGFKA